MATIIIAVGYLLILVPFFGGVLVSLNNEINKEIIYSFSQKNQFKRMFDSLQEGIVVLTESDGKIDFMNDFANKFTSFLAGL